jgi:hypothetical protein
MNSLSASLHTLPTENTVFYATIKAIERHVASHSFLSGFSRWQIGTTDDPGALLLQLRQAGTLHYWQVWEVSNRVAWSLQNYFRGRSMQTPDVPETSDAAARYLYLFKPEFSLRGLLQTLRRSY